MVSISMCIVGAINGYSMMSVLFPILVVYPHAEPDYQRHDIATKLKMIKFCPHNDR